MSVIAAEGYCQQVCINLVKIGNYIERIDNIPVIGKLTHLLPFALIAAGLKECPLQTALVVIGVLTYVASQNDTVRSKLQKYDIMGNLRMKKIHSTTEDDLLFVFDYVDEDDE